jgi:uncharacterized protein (TIGR00369 family)
VELFTTTPPPAYEVFGMRLVQMTYGRVVVSMPIQPKHGGLRPGVIAGPWLAGLVDTVAGATVQSTRGSDDPPFRGVGTVDLMLTYLAPASSDVTAEGRLVRAGRSHAFVEVNVHDTEGAQVVTAKATLSVARGD